MNKLVKEAVKALMRLLFALIISYFDRLIDRYIKDA